MPVSKQTMRAYTWLLRLYPEDVRYAYECEMRDDFARRLAAACQTGNLAVARTVIVGISGLLIDVAAQRAHTLYSHRSFHGRRRPDPGVVRPPNMSKGEWFGGPGSGM